MISIDFPIIHFHWLFRSWVNVVLNRTSLLLLTVTDISTTCAVVIFSVKVSCITSVDGIILWLLIGQLCHDVIGRLSVTGKLWCYWYHFDSEDDYSTGCRSLLKPQSLSTTKVLFRTTLNRTIKLNLPLNSIVSEVILYMLYLG